MIKRILVTSGKGGVGKTTITANVGAALCLMDQRVLLLDGDTGLRNLDAALGLQDQIIYDALDIAAGKVTIQNGAIRHPLYPSLDFIAAPQAGSFAQGQMQKLVFMLEELYDIILIDCPAGIDKGFANCASCAQMALVVATPDVTSVRDAIKTSQKLERMDVSVQYAVINRVRRRMAKKGGCMSADEAVELLQLPLLGSIMESDKIIASYNRGVMPIKGRERASFAQIAENLLEAARQGADSDKEVLCC